MIGKLLKGLRSAGDIVGGRTIFSDRDEMVLTLNGVTYRGRNIEVRSGGRVFVDGVEAEESITSPNGILQVHVVEGQVGRIDTAGDVHCGNVSGSISTSGDVYCGDVGGSIDTAGDVKAGNVGGSIDTSGDVEAGNVQGDIDTTGDVTAGDVYGNIDTTGDVYVKAVTGSISTTGDVNINHG